MCRDKMSAWSMVLEMNCGVQTTLSHLLEEAMPQKRKPDQNLSDDLLASLDRRYRLTDLTPCHHGPASLFPGGS